MNSQARLKQTLTNPAYDISAKYLAVSELLGCPEIPAGTISPEVLLSLEGIFKNERISKQVQAYFLYKQTAKALVSVATYCPDSEPSQKALKILKGLLGTSTGHAHRATAEALGSMPFAIKGPEISAGVESQIPIEDWDDLCCRERLPKPKRVVFLGRSLVLPFKGGESVFVVKLSQGNDSLDLLATEAAWMEYLRAKRLNFGVRFDVPEPLTFSGGYLCRLRGLPSEPPGTGDYAICFRIHREYFNFPNNPSNNEILGPEEFMEAISRNALILGKLAALGIVHSAPIPLFHNRIQSHRRGDGGLYEWPRGGRLDRWLSSCFYPNIGLTGVRDFEHFFSFSGTSSELYYYLGTHLLSLFLLAGSYFRSKNLELLGLDKEGRPVDARGLFDRAFLEALVKEVFLSYYNGFVGVPFNGEFPFNAKSLALRMVDEMGVDRHMEEILRRAYQDDMTDGDFRIFLIKRGFTEDEIAVFRRGAEDISINTGPHLGGFNEGISLPEMIEAVASMSAICIAGRYFKPKGLSFREGAGWGF